MAFDPCLALGSITWISAFGFPPPDRDCDGQRHHFTIVIALPAVDVDRPLVLNPEKQRY
jgi:hypothetical protein